MEYPMSKPSPARRQRPGEQFDKNTACVTGTIQKIWGRDEDVFARLQISLRGQAVETDDTQSCYINLRFPDGTVPGQDLSLQPGDAVQVTGYLTHNEFDESIRKFLEAAGKPEFLDNVPPDDLPAWQDIVFKRVNTMFNVEALVMLDENQKVAGQAPTINRVVFEGIVAREWTHTHGENNSEEGREDRYLRLAVYDRHTRVTKEKGNFGRPRRKPHYITILLPGGKAAEREVVVRLKDRLRVTGAVRDRGYRQTLHEVLLRTGDSSVIELMQRLPNAQMLHEIAAQMESGHIEASAVIVYASTRRKEQPET
jgi:hypothetical protein